MPSTEQVQAPSPDGVTAHLAVEIARLLPIPEGLDLSASWTELELESYRLLRLTFRLRQVPAWRHVDIQVFLSYRPLQQVIEDLRALIQAPKAASGGAPSILS